MNNFQDERSVDKDFFLRLLKDFESYFRQYTALSIRYLACREKFLEGDEKERQTSLSLLELDFANKSV